MVDRVLVPMDGSPLSERALEHALTAHPEAEVTVLYVHDFRETALAEPLGDHPGEFDEWLDYSRELAARVFDRAGEIAAEHDEVVSTASTVGKAARSIVGYAEEHDPDLIVLGSHGRSLTARLLLGSVANTVVRRAPCPVTVVR